jgi:transposase
MLRPSFVPPWPIRRLRDLTRYRIDLVGVRTAEKNRVEKLLEDACIKLSVVASDIFGVSGRAMMAALIAGERDPKVLAQLARSRMRTKIGRLEEAFDSQVWCTSCGGNGGLNGRAGMGCVWADREAIRWEQLRR